MTTERDLVKEKLKERQEKLIKLKYFEAKVYQWNYTIGKGFSMPFCHLIQQERNRIKEEMKKIRNEYNERKARERMYRAADLPFPGSDLRVGGEV